MDQDRFQLVFSVFEEAIAQPREVRAALLEERCGDDGKLRADVEAMLRADDAVAIRPGAGLENLARDLHTRAPLKPSAVDDQSAPVLVGQYRILEVLGEGGMGTVYLAEQVSPRRHVALKAIRRGLTSPQMVGRLAHEAHVLGRLHHPGIAQIYEAGVSDAEHGDQAYIAMELVRGLPINQYAAHRRLSIPDRLELIAKVCDAVHHAHQRGIIHRDLKPANILVDDAGQPKVLDFGVARLIVEDFHLTTMHTQPGQLVGTLAYMSPEQVMGDPEDTDTRSDVYALGVLLYELLTGTPPHQLTGRSLLESVRVIHDEHPAPVGSLNRACRGEIETIVARAMSKDRERRFQSAFALATDIRRHLAGEPIDSRRDSALYVLVKTLHRYRYAVATALLFMVLLAGFGAYSFGQARRERALAEQELAARQRADQAATQLMAELRVNNIEPGRLAGISGNRQLGERLLWDEFFRTPDALDARWALWDFYAHNPCLATASIHSKQVTAIARTPDGDLLVSHDLDGTVRVLDAGTLQVLDQFAATESNSNLSIDISPDGRTLAVAARRGVLLYDLERRAARGTVAQDGRPAVITLFAPDRDHLLTAGSDNVIELWDVASNRRIAELAEHTARVISMAVGPDGQLAAGDLAGVIKVWRQGETEAYAEIAAHEDMVSSLAFTPDAAKLVSGGRDRVIHVWDLKSQERLATLEAPNGTVRSLAVTRDGATLVSGGWWSIDGWDLATYTRKWSLAQPIYDVAIDPDGQHLFCCGATIRHWETATDSSRLVIATHDGRLSASFSHDGNYVVTGGSDARIRLCDAYSGDQIRIFDGHLARIKAVVFSPDDSLLATSSDDGTVRIWDVSSGETVLQFGNHNPQCSQSICFSSDGSSVACTDADLCVRLRDVTTGEVLSTFTGATQELIGVQFRPGTRDLACSTRAPEIRLWNSLGEPSGTLAASPAGIWTIACNGTGEFIATGTWLGDVLVYSQSSGQLIRTLSGHSAVVYGVDWSPTDPRILASAAADGDVKLWDVTTGTCLVTLSAFGGWDGISVDFSPDGKRVLAASANGEAVIWDLTYYDRHIEGNRAAQQLSRSGAASGESLQ